MFTFLNKFHGISWDNNCVFCLKPCQRDEHDLDSESNKIKQLNHLLFNNYKSVGFQSFFWQLVAGICSQTTRNDDDIGAENGKCANLKNEQSNEDSNVPSKVFTCSECSKSIFQLQHLHSQLERIQMQVINQVCGIQLAVDKCHRKNDSKPMKDLDKLNSIQQQILEQSKKNVIVPLVLVERFCGKRLQLPDIHSSSSLTEAPITSNLKVEPTEFIYYTSEDVIDDTNWSPNVATDSEDEYMPKPNQFKRTKKSSRTKAGPKSSKVSKRIRTVKKSKPFRSKGPTETTPSDNAAAPENPLTNHFQCSHCPKTYRRLPSYQKHAKTAHKVDLNFIQGQSSLNQHFETKEDKNLTTGKKRRHYNCPTCGEHFYSATLQYKHRMALHGAPMSKCKVCGKEFTTPSTLAVHKMLNHSGKGPRYKCQHCQMTFKQKSTYVNHMEAKHEGDEKRFTCEICGFMTKTKRFLTRHCMIHNKQHVCTVCGRKCSTRCSLKTHMRVHTGEVVICHECGYEFHNAKSLRRHVRNYHTGDNPLPLYPPQKRRKPRSHWKDADDGKRYYATNVVEAQGPAPDDDTDTKVNLSSFGDEPSTNGLSLIC